ncbi:hypothetical protein MACK_001751 [Theileria orientalis]|uniref:Uncharacterized protein n=1 Tax=Theileria orientalis TaxID=68886 RepID=A0A976QSJ6_THEOR|nr:hypothetical protein MACK_001751 [Theileria orientalis]
MKINTISAYVLVYLLARGHWNLMVPVIAEVEADGSSASASADGGSSSTGGSLSVPAGGSSSPTRARSKAGSSAGSTASSTAGTDVANLASLDSSGADGSSAAPEGSTASPDAGSIAGEGSGHVAGGSDADGTAGSSPEGASSGQAATGEVLLNGMYPDFYTSGLYSHKEHGETNPVLVAKREEAKRLADEARKAADDAKKAADEMLKAAEALTQAIDEAGDAAALEAEMKKLTATVDAKVYEVNVGKSLVDEVINPHDMMYYGGFPSGHHHRATDEALIKMYKLDRMANNEMWRVDFPNGWHGLDFGGLDMMEKEAKKYRDEKYEKDRDAKKQQIIDKEGEIKAKDKQIAVKVDELKLKNEAVDVKNNELVVKRREITELRELINELNRQLRDLENEARVLNSDHSKLFAEYKVLELGHKKLEDDRSKLLLEHKKLEDEDSKIVTEYYQLSGSTSYLDGKFKEKEISFDPRENFPAHSVYTRYTEPVKPKDGVYINPADTFSEHPLYTGASLSGGSAAPGAEAEVGETADASVSLASEAQPAEGVAQVADAAPAAEDHVASTPVAAPATHVADAGATPLAEGTSSGEAKAEGTLSVPAALRLFKAGADGNDVELVENTDYEKKHTSGDDKYEFKDGVMCTKVMYGSHELWKKGDQNVHEPKKVGFNGTVNAVVVSDNERTVVYKKEDNSEEWRHIKTVERRSGHGHGKTAAHTGPSASTSSTESAPAPGSLTTPLTGSTMNLASASTGSSEAEDKSSVASESSDNASESGSGSGLRGA